MEKQEGGQFPSPGATALKTVDEEVVSKELIFFPEDWEEGSTP